MEYSLPLDSRLGTAPAAMVGNTGVLSLLLRLKIRMRLNVAFISLLLFIGLLALLGIQGSHRLGESMRVV
ncbi:MAG: hypothetical protein RLZZ22_1494, partial [Pseudomonadota bacterium]